MIGTREHQQLTDKIAALMRWGTAAGSLLIVMPPAAGASLMSGAFLAY
jgi:hypothetical protein